MASRTDSRGVLATYRYDAHGRVISETTVVAAQPGANALAISKTVSYGYNSAGRLSSIVYPSGRKLTITYNGAQPIALALAKDATSPAVNLVSAIQWEPFGPARSWLWQLAGNAQRPHARVFDSSGRVVRHPLGSAMRDLSYDAADRITGYRHLDAATGTALPALDQSFSYDNLGRLTGVNMASANWAYSYDANGNRTSRSLNGSASASAYTTATTSNRLLAISNPLRSFAHDSAGNTLADGQFSAGYNLAGRLATLSKAGISTTYSVDGQGRRVRKFSSTGVASTLIFVYDQAGQLLGEYSATGAPIREYVWLGSTPIAMFTPDPLNVANPPLVYYFHTDHLDTPRMLLDTSNRMRWRWLAEPFGSTAPETNPQGLGPFEMNLRFAGQYADAESGLNYNHFRNYDAGVGRYLQSDPIGLAGGGINTYAYVDNQPTRYTDPMGLETYICRRPLGGAPGSYAPPLLNHTYVCVGSGVNMTCGSTTASSGGVASSIFVGSPGKPTSSVTDYYKPDACERRRDEDDCIETCIANELKKPTRPKYGVGPAGTDCQEYTEDVVSTCEKRCVRR